MKVIFLSILLVIGMTLQGQSDTTVIDTVPEIDITRKGSVSVIKNGETYTLIDTFETMEGYLFIEVRSNLTKDQLTDQLYSNIDEINHLHKTSAIKYNRLSKRITKAINEREKEHRDKQYYLEILRKQKAILSKHIKP